MYDRQKFKNSSDCSTILEFIWGRLKLEQEEWRKIYKSLYLLEIIMKVGAPSVINTIKSNIYKIKPFLNFTTKASTEKGAGIREKSKMICDLLDNPDLLEDEREKVRKLRSKLSGVSSTGGGKYGGISSTNYSSYSSEDYSSYKRKPKKEDEEEPRHEKKSKTKPKKENENEDEAEDYKKKSRSKKNAKAEDQEEKQEKTTVPEPKAPAPSVNLLDFDDIPAQAPPPTTNNIAELMPNLNIEDENDFGNFASAPNPAPAPIPLCIFS